MDWQAAETGLTNWVSAMTGIPLELIAWDREVVGFRKYPQVDMRFFDHRARDGMAPEILYPDPVDPDAPIQPTVVAQRACSWSITVTTRDQRAGEKAYVVLDALAVMLELPYTLDKLTGLGLAILDMGRVITNTDVPSEHRDLSQATLTLQFGYVLSVTAPDGIADAALETIEHAEVGGTAIEPDLETPITIDPKVMPPLEEVTP